MQPMVSQQQIIEHLERKLGIGIPLYNGAAVLNYEDDQKVSLEFAHQSSLFTIHTPISNVSAMSLDTFKMQDILKLNSRIDVLQGGWIGIHQESNSLRYFLSIPLQFATPDMILHIIDLILSIKKEISDKIFLQRRS